MFSRIVVLKNILNFPWRHSCQCSSVLSQQIYTHGLHIFEIRTASRVLSWKIWRTVKRPVPEMSLRPFPASFRSSPPEVILRKGVLKICSKFIGEHPCRSVIWIKPLCNFIEIILRHGCSPVNLQHIFRTYFWFYDRAFCKKLFTQKASILMLDRILNTPIECMMSTVYNVQDHRTLYRQYILVYWLKVVRIS